MLANSGVRNPKIQNGPHLRRQSSLDRHPPDVQHEKDDNVDVDGDHAHLCLEDGPALRQEWVGLEEHYQSKPHLTKVNWEMRIWNGSNLLRTLPDKCQFGNLPFWNFISMSSKTGE